MGKPKKDEKLKPAEDHIAEHDSALERLVAIAENAEFESGTLVGDIRDSFLDIVKNRPKPWSAMSEQEQRDLVRTDVNGEADEDNSDLAEAGDENDDETERALDDVSREPPSAFDAGDEELEGN